MTTHRHPLHAVPFSALGRYLPAVVGDPFDSVEIVPHVSDPRRYTCITLGGPMGFELEELDAAEAHAKIKDLLALGAEIRPGDHYVPSQRQAAKASEASERAVAELDTLRGKPTAGVAEQVVQQKVARSKWAGLDGRTLWTRDSGSGAFGPVGGADDDDAPSQTAAPTPAPITPGAPKSSRDAGGRTDAAFDELLAELDAAVALPDAPAAPVAAPVAAPAGPPAPPTPPATAAASHGSADPLPTTPRLHAVDLDALEQEALAREQSSAVEPEASAPATDMRSRFAALKAKREGLQP